MWVSYPVRKTKLYAAVQKTAATSASTARGSKDARTKVGLPPLSLSLSQSVSFAARVVACLRCSSSSSLPKGSFERMREREGESRVLRTLELLLPLYCFSLILEAAAVEIFFPREERLCRARSAAGASSGIVICPRVSRCSSMEFSEMMTRLCKSVALSDRKPWLPYRPPQSMAIKKQPCHRSTILFNHESRVLFNVGRASVSSAPSDQLFKRIITHTRALCALSN